MKRKEFIFDDPPILDETFHASGDNVHNYCDDSEALHHKVMVILSPHVINTKCQIQVLDEEFHYKELVFPDPYFAYVYSEKNSQKKNPFNELTFI